MARLQSGTRRLLLLRLLELWRLSLVQHTGMPLQGPRFGMMGHSSAKVRRPPALYVSRTPLCMVCGGRWSVLVVKVMLMLQHLHCNPERPWLHRVRMFMDWKEVTSMVTMVVRCMLTNRQHSITKDMQAMPTCDAEVPWP